MKHAVVIGGGVVGLTTAWCLVESGVSVTLVEREAELAQGLGITLVELLVAIEALREAEAVRVIMPFMSGKPRLCAWSIIPFMTPSMRPWFTFAP